MGPRRRIMSGERVAAELERAKLQLGAVIGYELTPEGGIIILTGGGQAAVMDELAAARARRDARRG